MTREQRAILREHIHPEDATALQVVELLDLEGERAKVIEKAAVEVVRAVRANAFIIPKDGPRRNRAIAAWDGLKTALGLRNEEMTQFDPDREVEVEETEEP